MMNPLLPLGLCATLSGALLASPPSAGLQTAQESAAKPSPQEQGQASVTVSGRIISADGKPVVGAAVAHCPSKDFTTGSLLETPQVRTGDDGRFEFTLPAIPPKTRTSAGTPMLHAAADGLAAVAHRVSWKYEERLEGADSSSPRARLNCDMGDIVLPPGTNLFGRIRNTDGAAIHGATVVATDMLEDNNQLPGTDLDTYCAAVSNKSGIFALPATLPQAVALEVSAPGHFRRQLVGVSKATPLNIELTPSGVIRGRVLDPDGRGIEGARVTIRYERQGPTDSAQSAEDGSFELNWDYDARYRLSFYYSKVEAKDGAEERPAGRGASLVLAGAQENLELQPTPATAQKGTNTKTAAELPVQVTGPDGQPLAAFKVSVTWQEFAQQNPAYGESILRRSLKSSPKPEVGPDGAVVLVRGPREGESTVGMALVAAEGCAPQIVSDVEWDEPEEGGRHESLLVSLAAEASAKGVLVDELSGEPVVGADVWAERRYDNNARFGTSTKMEAVTTAEDGSFHIRQLGEGSWQLRADHPDRPDMPPAPLDLKGEEQATGVRLEISPGARVTGRITGIPLPAGARAFLHPLPKMSFGGNGHFTSSSGSPIPNNATALGEGGSFEFEGVKLGFYMIVAVLPSQPRCGGDLAVPIHPLRVRRDGFSGDVDASDDVPVQITGSVKFEGTTTVPFHALTVVAERSDPDNNHFFGGMTSHVGARSFVQPDGTFSVPVTQGHYKLKLIHLDTGLQLASTAQLVEAKSGAKATADIAAQLAVVTVRLIPQSAEAPMAVVDRIELRFKPPANANQNGAMIFGGNRDEYDMGVGLPVESGATEVTLSLPAGTLTALARSSVRSIDPPKQRRKQTPIAKGEVEVDPSTAASVELPLEIGPPPEVPEDEPKSSEGK